MSFYEGDGICSTKISKMQIDDSKYLRVKNLVDVMYGKMSKNIDINDLLFKKCQMQKLKNALAK